MTEINSIKTDCSFSFTNITLMGFLPHAHRISLLSPAPVSHIFHSCRPSMPRTQKAALVPTPIKQSHKAMAFSYRLQTLHDTIHTVLPMDFDIETVSDVLSLLFKLDDQIDMKFEADKDDEGNFKPATVKLSFKNNLINKKLCTYMKALEIRENMLNAKDEYSEEEYADSLQHINENIEEIKQHLLDDNMVVKKGTDCLTVKNYPN